MYRLLTIQRVKEDKSFLDIRLSVGVCKEFYQNQIDSFILASSDSDYWGLIPTLEEARFLVLVEEEKVSGAIRHTLEDSGNRCKVTSMFLCTLPAHPCAGIA